MPDQFKDYIDGWQEAIDLLAELLCVPAALVMRIDEEEIEVFLASNSDGNPYTPGDREHLPESGLYCETVIRTRARLLVPDARTDPAWDSNPDIKLGMVSYLGYPLLKPDGTVFGTICLLDNKANAYSEIVATLLRQIKQLIESSFQILEERRRLGEAIQEIRQLRSLIPICSYCRKVRDDDGYWQHVEKYITTHTSSKFTHGMCPDCAREHFPELVDAPAGDQRQDS